MHQIKKEEDVLALSSSLGIRKKKIEVVVLAHPEKL
jgi:hypothetical protein